MIIKENYSLKNLNTFGVDVKARLFTEFNSIDDLKEILSNEKFLKYKKLILGSGSNILFTCDYDGLVIKNNIDGITITEEPDDHILLKIGGGVIWDDLVNYTVNNNYGGIENLSLIPGTVGAAPIQNIGAYGVEVRDVLINVEGIFVEDLTHKTFSNDESKFEYRDSIFKNELKDKFIITSILLKLNKNPKLNTEYAAIRQIIDDRNLSTISIKDLRDIVIEIRRSKLPDPKTLGNAGSFFKNPIITIEQLNNLQERYHDIVFYEIDNESVKIPAGWLIERSGFKGYREGNTGTFEKQALVIVNYGEATGKEIYNFSKKIKEEVFNRFEIELKTEVNILK